MEGKSHGVQNLVPQFCSFLLVHLTTRRIGEGGRGGEEGGQVRLSNDGGDLHDIAAPGSVLSPPTNHFFQAPCVTGPYALLYPSNPPTLPAPSNTFPSSSPHPYLFSATLDHTAALWISSAQHLSDTWHQILVTVRGCRVWAREGRVGGME